MSAHLFFANNPNSMSKESNKYKCRVPVNNELLTGTVPVNKKLLTGMVPVNKELLTGTGPVNNLFLKQYYLCFPTCAIMVKKFSLI